MGGAAGAAERVEGGPTKGRYRLGSRLRRLWPIFAAVGAALLLLVAFPPIDLWWLAPFGVALLGLATYRRGFWAGTCLGMITGLTLLIPLLSWAGGFVGPVWLFLPFGEACYIALLGGLSAVASPALTRWPWSWPLVTGSLWVLQEGLRDRTPFGGFPWGRLAFSQADSPLLGLAALGGAPLVTFGAAFTGGLIALAVRAFIEAARPYRWSTVRPAVAAVVIAIVATLAPLPLLRSPADSTVRVAIVQGNVPRLGLDFNAQRRAVLDNHVNATVDLARRVDAGQAQRPDLVIWPENSSDIDPIRNADARELIDQAARVIGAPILVGGLQDGPGPLDVRNIGLVWDPVLGPVQTYTKRHPVPFAEYVPMRSFVRHITTKVDLVRRDFVAGETPGVLTMGPATIGDVICFEVAYDEVVRDTVINGAQLLVVQTNNATFNEAEARQQLAMVRLRAVEHGRDALMSSTVGVSAFVDAAGNVYDATQFDAKAVIERTVVLRTARTMATRVGFLPEFLLVGVALGFLVAGIMLRRRRPAGRSGPDGSTPKRDVSPAGTLGEHKAIEDNTTRVAYVALGPNGSNRARLARVSGGVGPLDTRSSGGTSSASGRGRGEGLTVNEDYPGVGRVLVIIPTYNEADNVRIIVDRVRRAVAVADILVADDNSPDGTGRIADELAAGDSQVSVLHRAGKEGLGAAYLAGFAWARDRGYDAVVEMDADGSHAPEELPRLLDALGSADAVLGSRWVPGGTVLNWPLRRHLISRSGNLYTRLALRMPFKDATGGYRAYRMKALDSMDLSAVASQGYCFQVDLAWRAYRQGHRVVEVPITFAERERGASKMSSSIVREALWRVTVWGARARTQGIKDRLRTPADQQG